MTEPQTNVRTAACLWIVEALRAELPDVQVESGWPGAKMEKRTIWADEIEGNQELPLMLAGNRARDDTFTIPFEFRCKSDTLDAAQDTIGEMVGGLEIVLAAAVDLDNQVPGVVTAEIATERSVAARTPEGIRGFARVEVSVYSRLY